MLRVSRRVAMTQSIEILSNEKHKSETSIMYNGLITFLVAFEWSLSLL